VPRQSRQVETFTGLFGLKVGVPLAFPDTAEKTEPGIKQAAINSTEIK
jgi:hypothetical protein